MAIQHLRTRDPRWDMRSYVAIHISLIFGVGVLITGSIWAKGAWGHWWVWSEPTLVSFLLVMLLYATYQPLRFAIEDPERQARYASVFAITAGAFVPINFVDRAALDRLRAPAHARQHQRQPARGGCRSSSTSRWSHGAAVGHAVALRDDRPSTPARSCARCARMLGGDDERGAAAAQRGADADRSARARATLDGSRRRCHCRCTPPGPTSPPPTSSSSR